MKHKVLKKRFVVNTESILIIITRLPQIYAQTTWVLVKI